MVVLLHTGTLPLCVVCAYWRITRGYKLLIITLQLWRNGGWIRTYGPLDLALIWLSLFCFQLHRWRGFIMHACSPSLYITSRSSEESKQNLGAKQLTYTSHTPTSRARSNFLRGLCGTMERHDKTMLECFPQRMLANRHHPCKVLWMQGHQAQHLLCQDSVPSFQNCLNFIGSVSQCWFPVMIVIEVLIDIWSYSQHNFYRMVNSLGGFV